MEPRVEMVPLARIRPYENNPRRNDDSVPLVAESIQQFGFKVPLVIDRDGVIIAGHTRYKAAKQLGITEVPCIVASDLTPEQVRAYRLADNKVGEKSTWDFEALEIELGELPGIDMEALGFANIGVDFEAFDGAGDGGGSYMANGTRVRVVIGACMFDIDDPTHEIYGQTEALDVERVKAHIQTLLADGELGS